MASHGVPRQAQQPRQTDLAQIEAYKSLVSRVQNNIAAGQFGAETHDLTVALLRQNPEYYTIWNYHRLVLQDGISKASIADDTDGEPPAGLTPAQHQISLMLKEDLDFLIPLIKETPKCYWIWNHRKWLLRQATELLPVEHAKAFWQGELALDSKMLSYDARNFHGWSYRREIAEALDTCTKDDQGRESVIEAEFVYTTKMVKANLSNFSAWHNRSRLLCPLMEERKADDQARRKFLYDEIEFITLALYTDPADQSLWFYHQCLMDIIARPDSKLGDLLLGMDNVERLALIDTQLETLVDMMEDADDCKWIYQSLLGYHVLRKQLSSELSATTTDLRLWLDKLQSLDPLRRARWVDLGVSLGI